MSSCRIAPSWRRWLALAALALGNMASVAAAPAGDAPQMIFAGFAWAGNESSGDQLYPHSRALANKREGADIGGLLADHLARRPELAARLKPGLVDSKLAGNAIAMALVQESFEDQRIEGKHIGVLVMQANVLVFDMQSMMVASSYPVRHRYTGVFDHEPSPDDVGEMVRDAFTSADPRSNLIDLWLDRVASVRVLDASAQRLQVVDVRFSPSALRVIEANRQDATALRDQVANMLESSIADRTGVPLLPHVFLASKSSDGGTSIVANAVARQMLLRFSDKSVLSLKLKTADMGIVFDVRDFVSTTLEKPSVIQQIYRVKGTIALGVLQEPSKLDENIYDTLIVPMPRNSPTVLSEWDQYAKTLQGLIASVGTQLAKVDDRWLAEHASRNAEARRGFEAANEMIRGIK